MIVDQLNKLLSIDKDLINKDEEILEIKRQNDLINKELSKYSWKTKREFEKLFPCPQPIHMVEVENKEYIEEQQKIAIAIKTNKPYLWLASTECIYYQTHKEFWERWNRFQQLKPFL